jgi:hypothetical protein
MMGEGSLEAASSPYHMGARDRLWFAFASRAGEGNKTGASLSRLRGYWSGLTKQ